MKLPDALFEEMNDFFSDYISNGRNYENYFSNQRKSLKLLVDTAVEQVVEEITHKKPRNPRLARIAINAYASDVPLTDEWDEVISAINSLLAEYRILETKDYVEYEDGIRSFICSPLTRFCASLAAVSETSSKALTLAATLRKMNDGKT